MSGLSRRLFLGSLAASATVLPAEAAPDTRTARNAEERELLRFLRTLPTQERAAFVRFMQRVSRGVSTREALYRMHRELGGSARDARDKADEAIRAIQPLRGGRT